MTEHGPHNGLAEYIFHFCYDSGLLHIYRKDRVQKLLTPTRGLHLGTRSGSSVPDTGLGMLATPSELHAKTYTFQRYSKIRSLDKRAEEDGDYRLSHQGWSLENATPDEQNHGMDRWAHKENGPRIALDYKARGDNKNYGRLYIQVGECNPDGRFE